MMTRPRWALALSVTLLLALGIAGCSRSSGTTAGRLTVDGQADVVRPGEDRRDVTGSRRLEVGDRVRVSQGTAVIRLTDDRRLELRQGTDVELRAGEGDGPARPVLMGGDLLVVSDNDPLPVTVNDAEVAVHGDARVSRGVALLVAVYEGTARLSAGGSSLSVPAIRQAALPPTGQFPTEVSPFEYSPSDIWDQRYLSEAIELGRQLDARSQGFTAQLGPTEGRSFNSFRDLFPRLASEPAFTASLITPARAPGETLVGAAITLEGKRGTFAERWAGVFGFRDQGASWGLVALDQGVDRVAVLETIESAINRGPTQFAEGSPGRGPSSILPPSGSPATTTVPPRAATTTTVARARPTASTTTTTTAPPSTPTTAPRTGPLNTGSPLVDDTVNSLVDTLTGLLNTLGGGSSAIPEPARRTLTAMGDDQIVISSGQVITPETVLSRGFTSAFRGYHPAEVRQFLKRVSDEMAAAAEREVELRRALQDALQRVAHPELDEATVTHVLGEHAARLLASARDTAASITAEAEKQAAALVRDAEGRVARMREEADGLMARRVAEADKAADSIRHAAEAEARAMAERASNEAEALLESAKRQGKDMVSEARALRERMLGDLARRRRAAQIQIEQLRAARDRLLAAYDVVRRTVHEATTELEASEPEARLAAAAVGRRSEDPQLAMPPELERPAALVARPEAPARRQPPPAAAGAAPAAHPAIVFRRVEEHAPPPPPDRPPLRPQTVAAAVGGRMAAPALPAASPSAPPLPPPPAPPAPAPPIDPPSELATMEVPIVLPDVPPPADMPTGDLDELFARIRADEEHSPAEEPAAPASDPVTDERALEGRDDLLENLEAGLTRALKRVLQDEQNEVLDGLRRVGSSPPLSVLPEADAHVAAYRDAALPWLQQAARAGMGFMSDAAPEAAEPRHPALEAQARSLAEELVEPLRERLTRALEAGSEADDPSVVAESLRAAYRQWKVQHVEDAARHHALTAFNVGAFAATPEVATLQWLVDDDGHCPDCDDNALAGPTPKGQAFPTGQLHPPAHPGCRCLLVPVA